MAEALSARFYEILRIHLETGMDYRNLQLSKEQKDRFRVCLDTYKRLEINPYLNVRDYLKNMHQRTISEMVNDVKVVNYIFSVVRSSSKELARFKATSNAEKAMKMAYDQGNPDAMVRAGKHFSEVSEINKTEAEDLEEQIVKLPFAFVQDPRILYPEKTYLLKQQRDKLFHKYGADKDAKMVQLENTVDAILSGKSDNLEEEEEPEEVKEREEEVLSPDFAEERGMELKKEFPDEEED